MEHTTLCTKYQNGICNCGLQENALPNMNHQKENKPCGNCKKDHDGKTYCDFTPTSPSENWEKEFEDFYTSLLRENDENLGWKNTTDFSEGFKDRFKSFISQLLASTAKQAREERDREMLRLVKHSRHNKSYTEGENPLAHENKFGWNSAIEYIKNEVIALFTSK